MARDENELYNPFDNENVVPVPSFDVESLRRPMGGRVLAEAAKTAPVPETARNNNALSPRAVAVCDFMCGVLLGEITRLQNPPDCDDTKIIQEVLDGLEDSPFSLGWGGIPELVSTKLNVFINQTVHKERAAQGYSARTLSKLDITLPDWLTKTTGLELFTDCKLLDLTIRGDVSGTLAKNARFSRVTIEGDVTEDGFIGIGAERCNFEVTGTLSSDKTFTNSYGTTIRNGSFEDAKNCDIRIENLGGIIGGNLTASKVKIENVPRPNEAFCRVNNINTMQIDVPHYHTIVKT